MKRAALLIGLIAFVGVACWWRLQRAAYPPPNFARLEAQAQSAFTAAAHAATGHSAASR